MEPIAPKQPRKKARVLRWLLAGHTANRFEAARNPEIADSCLNSTVAELERDGVRIDREDEVVPGRYGGARCKRYRLNGAPENMRRARKLLGAREGSGE